MLTKIVSVASLILGANFSLKAIELETNRPRRTEGSLERGYKGLRKLSSTWIFKSLLRRQMIVMTGFHDLLKCVNKSFHCTIRGLVVWWAPDMFDTIVNCGPLSLTSCSGRPYHQCYDNLLLLLSRCSTTELFSEMNLCCLLPCLLIPGKKLVQVCFS